jgi:hypothetical protein
VARKVTFKLGHYLAMRRGPVEGPWVFPTPKMSGHIKPSSLQGQQRDISITKRYVHPQEHNTRPAMEKALGIRP